MKVLCILNHKGGTGKTTSSVNIAAELARRGKRTLLIDLDPQSNLTEGLGIRDPETSIYHSIREGKKLPVINITEKLDLVPSSLDLVASEIELSATIGRELILKKLIAPIRDSYDYIIIDCPPALGMLTLNALVVSNSVLIPMEAEFYAYKGIDRLVDIIRQVRENYNGDLTIGGVFITKYNPNRILTSNITNSVKTFFDSKLFDTKIRINVALGEAPVQGLDIFRYAENSNGAKDYKDLVSEIVEKV